MSPCELISCVDTAWLRMDRPNNLMQIVGVLMFDGQLDEAQLRTSLEYTIRVQPRFHQKASLEGGEYYWRDDPDFDLDLHLKRVILPGKAGKAELERLVADFASTPLNHQRPLWEMHLVDTSLGGQALVVRFHHAMGDGFSLVRALLTMMDESPVSAPRPQPEPLASDHDDDHDAHQGSRLLRAGLKLTGTLWSKYVEVLAHPTKAMEYLKISRDVTAELYTIATLSDDARTRLKGETGSTKRVAWSEQIPLPDVKAVGRVLGCSVNDLLIAATAGALRHYLIEKGDAADGVAIRALVPVNMRAPDDNGALGNRFGLVALDLPLDIEHPLQRLHAVRERMQALKSSLQPAVVLNLLEVMGMAPKALQQQTIDILSAKASAVITNVPGPQQTLYLAGARLRQPLFWVPQAGDIGVGVSILSYDNKVQLGLITDKKRVPDPDLIVDRFAVEFEQLLLLVLMEPDLVYDPEVLEQLLQGG
ncbi:WS/DGAT/MGAT family O-acyltransferase [Aeromonas salmonicida]|uniref:WS/DGAT/MGAT family O-acyltransferase n=1 Tax=Aeromonas salmonicida TaxID=645 RepID=UPI001BA8A715|nr:wax ester/triacylglycerol synthase family O-acyltransferase [Aeromonas salmonicida]MBS2781127.1 wax ester/triacylglycerol synthase family O-acyltransferase [Aeromonas salmonicida]HEH9407267.1 wax ester/triacylglycerol synthase family O-acyltransferase [Aeromonas salmonicida]